MRKEGTWKEWEETSEKLLMIEREAKFSQPIFTMWAKSAWNTSEENKILELLAPHWLRCQYIWTNTDNNLIGSTHWSMQQDIVFAKTSSFLKPNQWTF